MSTRRDVEIAIIGAGVVGIATAFYLCTKYEKRSVLLVDSRQPLSYTSAQSGDNYRNWWPHPTMVSFTNSSIDLMERIATESSNVLNMTRRGYALATRRPDIDELIAELHACYKSEEADMIRIHNRSSPNSYQTSQFTDWTDAPDGVDVLSNQQLIQQTFPSFTKDIKNVVHIRRAGGISSQQMCQYMLGHLKRAGGERVCANVHHIDHDRKFLLELTGSDGVERIFADKIVNAAGPFAGEIAAMIGVDLPIVNVFQQKIAFEDRNGAIPRDLPFSIDLDEQELDWTTEERELFVDDPDMDWLVRPISGGAHCRPEGGDDGTWIKLGWAYNTETSNPHQELTNDPNFDPQFPEIVLRGASTLNTSLRQYIDPFPSRCAHYGGYYSMTPENWPLIGPLGVDGAYIAGALSGFGSMAACAAGDLCAAWVTEGILPEYASDLSSARYDDRELMAEIGGAGNKGVM